MLFHRCSTFFSHTQRQPYHIRHKVFDLLPLLPIFLHVHVCLFFQAQELPTLFRSIKISSTAFSSTADNILFQLTRICLLYSMTFPHFSVVLVNNLSPCWLTTDKFTKLISIFKTQRKQFQATNRMRKLDYWNQYH